MHIRKDFGVEDKYDKERWKKKDTTIRGNNTGWDILDGYLYREGFPFAPVQMITEPQTGKTTGLKDGEGHPTRGQDYTNGRETVPHTRA